MSASGPGEDALTDVFASTWLKDRQELGAEIARARCMPDRHGHGALAMSRRVFLERAALTLAGTCLGGCSLYFGQHNRPPKHLTTAEDVGTLHPVRTQVKGLQMYSLVSTHPAPPDAPAVVLVHGSGLSGAYMLPTARELTDDFRVYLPDLPGFGDSDKPEEVLGVPELADWLAAWMPAIGLPRASLLGNSFGCQVIADLAARYPERVERAILQGPTTPPEERSWFWQFIRWRQNQRFNPPSLSEPTREAYRKAGARRMFWSFCEQITDRIEAKAPNIQAPVLVVRGEHDPVANQRWCEWIADLCPRGSLVVIPGVAHTLCWTAPVELAVVTGDFVNAGRPAPS